MIQDFDWQQWNHIPRLAMSVAEVGYNRYQVRLQTSFDEGAVTRLTTLSSTLRDEISNSFREPYSEPEPTAWHRIGGQLYDTFLPGTLGEMLQDAQAVYRRESSLLRKTRPLCACGSRFGMLSFTTSPGSSCTTRARSLAVRWRP